MAISTKLSMGIHLLTYLEIYGESQVITSDVLADSINTSPVIVRRLMSQLKKAGIIYSAAGKGNPYLLVPSNELTLLAVYHAVEKKPSLIKQNESPNPNCPVGRNIQRTLEQHFNQAQAAFEAELAQVTIADIVGEIKTAGL